MRGRILAELRRRRDAWEPTPSARDLAAILGTDLTTIRYHLALLRAAGLVHPDGAAITAKGYELGN
jgi:DNA-binding transcriptional ArsR family regulator